MTDPFVGSLTFARVYSGVMETGSSIVNSVKGNRERIGRMLLMHANHREDVKSACAGDIVALAGLKNVTTGDTLCDISKPIILERMEFSRPRYRDCRGNRKTKGDQEKNGYGIGAVGSGRSEFPCVERRRERTNDHQRHGRNCTSTLSSTGCGASFKVDANIGAPQVAYRETFTKDRRSRLHTQENRPAVRGSSPVLKSSLRRAKPGNRIRV